MWELDCEESWAPKNWCFWTVVLQKTVESPLDCKEIQPVYPKGDQSQVFIGRTDAKAETPILWPSHAKSWLIGKDPDAERDWGQEEKGMTEDEMAGWHHLLDGHEFEWTPGVGDGQGGLACCDSWGRKELDMTERLNWTDVSYSAYNIKTNNYQGKAMVFPVVIWMWELDHKKGWVPKNWCFWIVVLEKTFASLLECKEIKPISPKGNQSLIFIGRTDAEAEDSNLWFSDEKNRLIWIDPDIWKDWRQEEKGTTENDLVGWHHRLNGHEFEQTPRDSDGQWSLACCSSWGHKGSDRT